MIDPKTVLTNRQWRHCRFAETDPHDVYVANDNGSKFAVLTKHRTKPNGDWALNELALRYIAKALREQRLAQAWVLLLETDWSVGEAAPVDEVLCEARDHTAN